MTRIFVVRHAEAEGNLYRRAHGHFDGGVTGTGYLQIERLKKRFESEKIDAVYSSDLFRTRTTAVSVYESRGLTLITDKRLREVDIGEWEDVSWGDIEYNMPEMCGYFTFDPAKWSVKGSESYTNVRERMTECITELARRHDGQSIAVFTHGFAIRAFLCALMSIPSEETQRIPYCDNTAVALLQYDDGRLSIEYHGDNSHLEQENSTFAKQTWWRGEKDRRHENLRYLPFDGMRDGELFKLCRSETAADFDADIAFTAFLADKPAGILGLSSMEESGENAGWINYIYVKPEYRGMGVQLLGQAVSVYRKLGRAKLRLKTEKDSRAIPFFLKYGFSRAGDTDILEKDIKNGA